MNSCMFFVFSLSPSAERAQYHCPIIIHRLSAAVDKSNYGGLQDSQTEEGCVFISQGDFLAFSPSE